MNKKAWLVILAVTTAVTVFIFSMTWVLRPNSSTAAYADKVFEEAKARQGKSLVSITEPLNTDVEALSEEERMAREVAALLSENGSFISDLSKSVTDDIKNELDAWGSEYKNTIVTEAKSIGDEYKSEINSSLDSYITTVKKDLDGKLAKIDADNALDSQENRVYTDNLVRSANKNNDKKLEELKGYIDAEIALSRMYTDSLADALNSQIEQRAKDAESYINKKTDTLSYTIDSKAQESSEYSDSLWAAAKDYSLSTAKGIKAYIDQKFAEYEEKKTQEIINIHTSLPLMGAEVLVDAYQGYGILSFPEFVTRDDLEYGVEFFYNEYPELKSVVTFRIGTSDIVAIYPQSLAKADVEFGISAIGDMLSTIKIPNKPIEPEVEIIPALEINELPPVEEIQPETVFVVDEKPEVIPAMVVEETAINPYEFEINMEVPLFDDVLKLSANASEASFRFPSSVSTDVICDALVMLLSAYPNETSDFDFTVDDSAIAVGFDRMYKESEVRTYIDFLISFYSDRMDNLLALVYKPIEALELEPAEVVVVEEPEVVLPIVDIYREYDLFGSKVTLHASDRYARLVLPSFVLSEEIVGAMEYLSNTFPEETAAFKYSLDQNVVDLFYEPIFTQDQLESYIDVAANALWPYIQSLLPPPRPVVPAPAKFVEVERDLVTEPIRVPAPPLFEEFVPSSIAPNPNIADEKIPEVRNAIRDIEVERYLNLL